MLPRRFMVRSILEALRTNAAVADHQLLATRIADQIEFAAKVFESDDDPAPVLDLGQVGQVGRANNLRQMPLSPEDLGQDEKIRRTPRAVQDLPQPVNGKQEPQLVVLADSAEAQAVWEERGHEGAYEAVRAIRPARTPRDGRKTEGEQPQWEFQELYAEVIGGAPVSIEVTPQGVDGTVTLDRSFQADPGSGVVKVVYSVPGQRGSSPSSPDDPQAAVTIPIDVSTSFSIFSPRSIDFPAIVAGLKATASKSFAPRPEHVVSATPRTGGSLENIYRKALNESRAAGAAPGVYTGGISEDSESSTPVIRSPQDHWDPLFKAREGQRSK